MSIRSKICARPRPRSKPPRDATPTATATPTGSHEDERMKIEDQFRVNVPFEQAWNVLLDVERIAPCMPGAQLQEVEGDEYRGIVKVKVGPITAQYKGKATFQNLDVDNHVAVLRAEGRDTRGQGNANATITATLTADGDGTAVEVVTDL